MSHLRRMLIYAPIEKNRGKSFSKCIAKKKHVRRGLSCAIKSSGKSLERWTRASQVLHVNVHYIFQRKTYTYSCIPLIAPTTGYSLDYFGSIVWSSIERDSARRPNETWTVARWNLVEKRFSIKIVGTRALLTFYSLFQIQRARLVQGRSPDFYFVCSWTIDRPSFSLPFAVRAPS